MAFMADRRILFHVDCLVLGGNTAGVVCALSLRKQGKTVLLMEEGTCLMADVCAYGYQISDEIISGSWMPLLFPSSVRSCGNLLHPDRLKRHVESLVQEAGINLLYAAQAFASSPNHTHTLVAFAHKGGLFGVSCSSIFDMRKRQIPEFDPSEACILMSVCGNLAPLKGKSLPVYSRSLPESAALDHAEMDLLSGPGGQEHGFLRIPVSQKIKADDDANFLCKCMRYSFTQLAHLRAEYPESNLMPARSSCVPISLRGLNIAEQIQFGLHAAETGQAPHGLHCSDGRIIPVYAHNPLYDGSICPVQVPVTEKDETWDVLVVGGGTAGAAAAIASAENGARTLVLDMNPVPGGTATAGGVSSYWYGTRDGMTARIDSRVQAIYDELGIRRKPLMWSQNDVFLPDIKAIALLEMCIKAGCTLRLNTVCFGVLKDSSSVCGAVYTRSGHACSVRAQRVIDATGDGDLAVFAGAAHQYGSSTDALTYWASLPQYTSPNTYTNNFTRMVHVGDPMDYTRFIVSSRKIGESMYDHGSYVAVRESRHICGTESIDLKDVLSGKYSETALYTCFSNYDPKGKLSADIVYAGLLPPNIRFCVPAGTMLPIDGQGQIIKQLLVGGKATSITHNALPGLRMQADLQQQGCALGTWAAVSAINQIPLEKVAPDTIRKKIEDLGGQHIEHTDTPSVSAHSLKEAIAALTGHEPLHCLEQPCNKAAAVPDAVTILCLADSQSALPLLREAFYATNEGDLKLLLARLLCWHGDDRGAQVIVDRIQQALDRCPAGLPRRVGSVRFGQLLPDHGLMPEPVYLLNTLAWAPSVDIFPVFKRVADRLQHLPLDWYDIRAGIYCYFDSFAFVASRRGGQTLSPLIWCLLGRLSEVQGNQSDALIEERISMLRLALLEALWRYNDPGAKNELCVMAADRRRPISLTAQMVLSESGVICRKW